MGFFDGPTYKEQMLAESRAQTDAQRKQTRIAKQRAGENAATNRKLVNAANARTAADTAAAQRQAQAAAQLSAAQQRALAEQTAIARERARREEVARWAMYRQTPDGVAWAEWLDHGEALARMCEGRNEQWAQAADRAVARIVSDEMKAWHATGRYLPADHPACQQKIKGFGNTMRFFVGLAKAGSDPDAPFKQWQKILTKANPQYAEDNAHYRDHLMKWLVAQVGFDPLREPKGRPPGWLVDDVNHTISSGMVHFKQFAMRDLPPKSELPGRPVLVVRPVEQFQAPELAELLEKWTQQA